MAGAIQRGLSTAQKTELWERWRQGETVSDIGRALGTWHSSIGQIVRHRGGFSPLPRHRAAHGLTLAEREEISRGLVCGDSYRHIGRQLERSASTISREVQRNGGRDAYRAARAEQATWDRARRPKPCKLALQPRLRRLVADRLRLAQASISTGRVVTGVTRDHLPQSVCAGPRASEARVAQVPAFGTASPPRPSSWP